MDWENVIEKGITFFRSHTVVAAIIIVVLCVFGYLKPKEFFKLLLLAAALGVGFYIISLLADSMSSGLQQKDTMMHKSQEVVE